MESSLCEKPERHASRRLSDHLTFEGLKQKVHSLVDKVTLVSPILLSGLRETIHESGMRENCTFRCVSSEGWHVQQGINLPG
jgi:hypothetical protein